MSVSKSKLLERGSTYFLKLVLIVLGISAIALSGLLLYVSFTSDDVGAYRPVLLAMIVTAIPFLLSLNEANKLLGYIRDKIAFSDLSVTALKKIKTYAFVMSGFYAVCMPYIYLVAERDDAPGGILIGIILVIAPFIIAVFAAILQELLQNAIDIKSENDLTI